MQILILLRIIIIIIANNNNNNVLGAKIHLKVSDIFDDRDLVPRDSFITKHALRENSETGDINEEAFGATYDEHMKSKIDNAEETRLVKYFTRRNATADLRDVNLGTLLANSTHNAPAFPSDDIFRSQKHKHAEQNITTCKEFGEKAYFHPKTVLFKTWVSFYMWTAEETIRFETTFNFSIPSIKTVNKFKKTYEAHLKKQVDWDQPKIMMISNDLVFLLLATDHHGGFVKMIQHGDYNFPRNEYFQMPVFTIKLKLVGPYVAMMFCEDPVMVYACALDNHPPENPEAAAASIGVRGIGGATLKRRSEPPRRLLKTKFYSS